MARPRATATEIAAAAPADVAAILALLAAEKLPTADLDPARMERFLVARTGGQVVGAIGRETHGAVGLLRSLVVRPSHRGSGLGAALCDRLEAAARADGIRDLYLLTTTAAAFFARCGYRAVARELVPPALLATAEFRSLCPSTATCMTRRLADDPVR